MSNFFDSINRPATWGLCSYYAKEHFLSETLYGHKFSGLLQISLWSC